MSPVFRLRRLLLSLFLVTIASGGWTFAETLYGTAFNGPDGLASLYTISPASGAGVLVGPIGFQRVSSIDFGPDGRLYGVGERNDGTNTVVLIVINTATGVGKEVGPLGIAAGRPVTDINFRPSDGRLYAYLDIPDEIATIERATGLATVLGPVVAGGGGGNGLVFGRNVTLYVIDTLSPSTTLYRVNQTTGANTALVGVTYIGFPAPTGIFRVNAADAQPSTGTIYTFVNDNFGGGGPLYLATLDPPTGNVRNIGLSVPDLDGLAWEPDRCRGVLYGTAKTGGPNAPSSLYRLDPQTGAAVLVGPIGFNGVSGIDVNPLTGVLYGTGNRPAGGAHVLIKIDPGTGVGVEIGPLVNAAPTATGGVFDLSFRSDGTLYLNAFDAGGGALALFTVNQVTGFATQIGATGTIAPGNGTAFSLSDVLYLSDRAGATGTLYTVNTGTGLATTRSAHTYIGFPALVNARINAMDTDVGTGAVWAAVNDGGGGAGPNYLAVLDPRTGNVRHVAPTVAGLDGVAWMTTCNDGNVCTLDQCAACVDGTLLGAAYTGADGLATLYRVDPASGTTAVVGPIGFQRVSAMDFDDLTGVLYATGERNDGSNTNVLLAIDPATGAGNEIGPTGIGGFGFSTEPDIAIRNFDGQLYAYLDLGDGVATLDKTTGAATFLGNSGVAGFGNGLDFTTPADELLLADGNNLDRLNQATGAAAVGPLLSYVGFPAPLSSFRVNAMDHNCSGRIFAAVRDGGGGAGPSYLATVATSGAVTHVGATLGNLDALAWTSRHGFCLNAFQDADADTYCDAVDCAPANAGVWAIPPEITTDRFPDKVNYTWTSLAPVAGPATTYDIVADLLTGLPVGPGGGGEASVCGFGPTSIGVGTPVVGSGFWFVVRGHNVCAAGSYGTERHNNLAPFPLLVQRTTTTCP